MEDDSDQQVMCDRDKQRHLEVLVATEPHLTQVKSWAEALGAQAQTPQCLELGHLGLSFPEGEMGTVSSVYSEFKVTLPLDELAQLGVVVGC